MGAPAGNNYWEFRHKHGASFKYNAETLWAEALRYFDWQSQRVWNKKDPIKSGDSAGALIDVPTSIPFSIKSFCIYADIVHQTFLNYRESEDKDLMEVATRIQDIIESQQFEGATVGAYNPNIIARTLGLTDRTDLTSGGKEISSTPSIIQVEVITPKDE